MEKNVFSSFRMPACELPNRSSHSFPIKLSIYGSSSLDPSEKTVKTDPLLIKKQLQSSEKFKNSSEISCQVDFQQEFQKQLEKEILTEPRMQFLDVNDIEMDPKPIQTQNGFVKFPEFKGNFLQTTDFEVVRSTPNSEKLNINKFPNEEEIFSHEKGKKINKDEKKIFISKEDLEKFEIQARDPIAEKKETQDFKLKMAAEKLSRLEEEASKLEQEMKVQNEHLDKISGNFFIEQERLKKDYAIKMIEKMEKNSKDDEKNEADDERVSRILNNNQELYMRIQRALTPKIKVEEEEPVKEEKKVVAEKINKFNPIISKRISAAMNTAAQAIQTSNIMKGPIVLKKPKK